MFREWNEQVNISLLFFIAFLFKKTLGPRIAQHLAAHRGLYYISLSGQALYQICGAGRGSHTLPYSEMYGDPHFAVEETQAHTR